MSPEKKLKIIPWVVGLGLFIENIDITVINTSLPEIAYSLQTDPLDLKIGITSYLLTLTALIPISGYIADRIGTKKTFLLAIAIFMFGSLVCGFATNIHTLVAGRLIQGGGGAIMAPVGRLILVKTFSRAKFVQAFSYVVIVGQMATVIGPIVGGITTNFFDWRFIFFVNIPIGIFALIMVKILFENIKSLDVPRFDWIGFFIFSAASSFIILPLTLLTQKESVSFVEYYFLIFGTFLLGLYFLYSKKISNPIINLNLFKIRTYRLSSIGNIISRSAIGGIPFMLPLLFQLNFGFSVLQASEFLLPYGIGFLSAKFILKKILNLYGFKKVLLSNTLLLSSLLLIFSTFNTHTSIILLIIILYVFGSLTSLHFSCMSILNYTDIEKEQLSQATSLSSVIQQFSLGLSVCMVAGCLVFFDRTPSDDDFIPLYAFKYTFYFLSSCMFCACLCFMRLYQTDGDQVLNRTPKTEQA